MNGEPAPYGGAIWQYPSGYASNKEGGFQSGATMRAGRVTTREDLQFVRQAAENDGVNDTTYGRETCARVKRRYVSILPRMMDSSRAHRPHPHRKEKSFDWKQTWPSRVQRILLFVFHVAGQIPQRFFSPQSSSLSLSLSVCLYVFFSVPFRSRTFPQNKIAQLNRNGITIDIDAYV